MGAWWIVANQDAIVYPANDTNLALTVHSYSPYSFAGLIHPVPDAVSFTQCLTLSHSLSA